MPVVPSEYLCTNSVSMATDILMLYEVHRNTAICLIQNLFVRLFTERYWLPEDQVYVGQIMFSYPRESILGLNTKGETYGKAVGALLNNIQKINLKLRQMRN